MKKYMALILVLTCVLSLVGCAKASGEAKYDWGIELTAKDVTNTGLTIVCRQSGGEVTGELFTGSFYKLEVREGKKWTDVEYLHHEEEITWTMEAWGIPIDDSTEWEVDWEWLYGELSAGEYRIGKSVMDFREAGDFDEQMFYAEFSID